MHCPLLLFYWFLWPPSGGFFGCRHVAELWESLHNSDFKLLEFEGFRREAGLNAFTLCSLLRNRIKAMVISKLLIESELSQKEQRSNVLGQYTKEELAAALRPVVSVISKCEKAQEKFDEGTSHHQRLDNLIKAMDISKGLIEDQLILMG